MKSILFICAANICRSPALEATLRHLAVEAKCADQLHIDSCGVGWSHLGQHPDPRMFSVAQEHGILIDHRAQQFQEHFFQEFDHLFAVDEDVRQQIAYLAKKEKDKKKVEMASAYSINYKGKEIPDPYYLNSSGFEQVMEMIFDCCRGILRNCL